MIVSTILKINRIKNQLSEENYSSFPFLQTIEKYGNIFENDKAVQIIDNLILEFSNRSRTFIIFQFFNILRLYKLKILRWLE